MNRFRRTLVTAASIALSMVTGLVSPLQAKADDPATASSNKETETFIAIGSPVLKACTSDRHRFQVKTTVTVSVDDALRLDLPRSEFQLLTNAAEMHFAAQISQMPHETLREAISSKKNLAAIYKKISNAEDEFKWSAPVFVYESVSGVTLKLYPQKEWRLSDNPSEKCAASRKQ